MIPKIWHMKNPIAVNLISSKHIDEKNVMHSNSNNMEIMAYDQIDEVIKDLFESVLYRY